MWISFSSTLTQHWSAPRLGCLLLFQRKNPRVSSSIWKPWPATILRKWRTHYDQKTQRTSQRRFLHWLVLLPALGWKQKAHWFFQMSQKPESDSYFILKFCNNTRTDFKNKNLESEVITKSRTHPTLLHLVRTQETMFPFARFIVQSTFQACRFSVLFLGILSCSSSMIIHSARHVIKEIGYHL